VGEYTERAERLVEAVEIIRQLWTWRWMSAHGRYYDVGEARLYDHPGPAIRCTSQPGDCTTMELRVGMATD